MNYRLVMAMTAELQSFLALMQSPDVRWEALQQWIEENPRWRAKIGRYSTLAPDKAVEDLKAYLIEQTGVSNVLADAAITPDIRAKAISSIERLQEMYQARLAETQKALPTKKKSPSKKRKVKTHEQ